MFKSLSLLWISTFFGAALSFITQTILARSLNVSEFGDFSAALSVASLAAPLAGFGVASYWLKVFGEEGWGAIRWLKPSLYFVCISSAFVLCGLIIWIISSQHDPVVKNVLYALCFYVLGQMFIDLISARYQLEERYTALAVWQFFPHLLRFLTIAVVLQLVMSSDRMLSAAYCYFAVSILFIILGLNTLTKMYQKGFDLKGHGKTKKTPIIFLPSIRNVFIGALPFGLAGFLHLVYFQSNIIIVSYLSGSTNAGIYGVAFIIISAVYLFPAVIYQKYLMPKVHRWSSSDQEKLKRLYFQGNIVMLVFGFFAMLGVFIFAPFIIDLFFGNKYEDSLAVLKLLALAIPIRFLATSLGCMLTVKDNIKIKVFYMACVACFSCIVNFSLISLWGIKGAALASVLSELLLLALYYYGVNKFVFR